MLGFKEGAEQRRRPGGGARMRARRSGRWMHQRTMGVESASELERTALWRWRLGGKWRGQRGTVIRQEGC